jgi:hypothetical protein
LVRGFRVSPALRKWLEENQVDVAKLQNAVRASLGKNPIQETSTPIIFWKFNQAIEVARELADFAVAPSRQLTPWLLKFKRSA